MVRADSLMLSARSILEFRIDRVCVQQHDFGQVPVCSSTRRFAVINRVKFFSSGKFATSRTRMAFGLEHLYDIPIKLREQILLALE
jgi:hypothetical protein